MKFQIFDQNNRGYIFTRLHFIKSELWKADDIKLKLSWAKYASLVSFENTPGYNYTLLQYLYHLRTMHALYTSV